MIFSKKIKPQVNYSKLLKEKENLLVILPDSLIDTYNIFSVLKFWENYFQSFIFYLPNFSFSFFSKLTFSNKFEFFNTKNSNKLSDYNIIFDFGNNEDIKKQIKKFNKSVVLSKEPETNNLIFKPDKYYEDDILVNLSKLAKFIEIPFNKIDIVHYFNDPKNYYFPSKFFKSNDNNISLDIHLKKKHLLKIILTLLNNQSYNIYLCNNEFQLLKDNINNLYSITDLDLYNYVNLAIHSTKFITDDEELASLFNILGIKYLFFNKDKTSKIDSIKIKDLENIY